MDKPRNSRVVHNDTEFYITVAQFKKPLKIKPLTPDGGEGITLSEMECKALIVPPGAEHSCQCCTENFPPAFPFIVEENEST